MADKGQPVLPIQFQLYWPLNFAGRFPVHQEIQICKADRTTAGRPVYPLKVQDTVSVIVSFCDSTEPLLRERAINALGRIGRSNYSVIEPYWTDLFRFASDEEAKVRLSFIWASENIATNTPGIYENQMSVFEKLLHDTDDKVRMEAPEIFRVLGKRRLEFVRPFVQQLQRIAENDDNCVVRIHCLGAIKAAGSN